MQAQRFEVFTSGIWCYTHLPNYNKGATIISKIIESEPQRT